MRKKNKPNPYELLANTDVVTKEINTILSETIKRLDELAKKYSQAGLGDTATDKSITLIFYDRFHFRTKKVMSRR